MQQLDRLRDSVRWRPAPVRFYSVANPIEKATFHRSYSHLFRRGDPHAFVSRKCEWAILVSPSIDATLLAGSAAFIDAFCSELSATPEGLLNDWVEWQMPQWRFEVEHGKTSRRDASLRLIEHLYGSAESRHIAVLVDRAKRADG
jgi:hypothetical protein